MAYRELDLRNREVERATQLKSKFLASMSHQATDSLLPTQLWASPTSCQKDTAGQTNGQAKTLR